MSTFFCFFSKKSFFFRPIEKQRLVRGCTADNGEKCDFSAIMSGMRVENTEWHYGEWIKLRCPEIVFCFFADFSWKVLRIFCS